MRNIDKIILDNIETGDILQRKDNKYIKIIGSIRYSLCEEHVYTYIDLYLESNPNCEGEPLKTNYYHPLTYSGKLCFKPSPELGNKLYKTLRYENC